VGASSDPDPDAPEDVFSCGVSFALLVDDEGFEDADALVDAVAFEPGEDDEPSLGETLVVALAEALTVALDVTEFAGSGLVLQVGSGLA
jgi:hypothetical protein